MPCNAPRSPARAWAPAERRARWIDADTDTDTATDIASHIMHLPAASVHALVGAPRDVHAAPTRSRAPLQTSWREAIALVEQSEYHRFHRRYESPPKKARRRVTSVAARPPRFAAGSRRWTSSAPNARRCGRPRRRVVPVAVGARSSLDISVKLYVSALIPALAPQRRISPLSSRRLARPGVILRRFRRAAGEHAVRLRGGRGTASTRPPLPSPMGYSEYSHGTPRGTRCTSSRRARHRFHPPRPAPLTEIASLPCLSDACAPLCVGVNRCGFGRRCGTPSTRARSRAPPGRPPKPAREPHCVYPSEYSCAGVLAAPVRPFPVLRVPLAR
jgi:hypothetical protein